MSKQSDEPVVTYLGDCDIDVISPVQYEQLVVDVSTYSGTLFFLTDEDLSRRFMVDLIDGEGRIRARIPLVELRLLLDRAEQRLLKMDLPPAAPGGK